MKKKILPLFVMLMIPALVNLPNQLDSSRLVETTLLEDQKGYSLSEVRRNAGVEDHSQMYSQYAKVENEGKTTHYIRFAMAVKNATKITYERKFEGFSDVKTGNIFVIYKSLKGSNQNWYYDGIDITYIYQSNDYYWATYTLELSEDSEYLNSNITLSMYIDDNQTPVSKTTSLSQENNTYKNNGDGTHTKDEITENCHGRKIEDHLLSDASGADEEFLVNKMFTYDRISSSYLHGICSDGKYIYATGTKYADSLREYRVLRFDINNPSKVVASELVDASITETFAGITYYNGKVITYRNDGSIWSIDTDKFVDGVKFEEYNGFDSLKTTGNIIDIYQNPKTKQFAVKTSSGDGTLKIYNENMEFEKSLTLIGSYNRMTATEDYIYVTTTDRGYSPKIQMYSWIDGTCLGTASIPTTLELMGMELLNEVQQSEMKCQGLVFVDEKLYVNCVGWNSTPVVMLEVGVNAGETCVKCGAVINHEWSNFVDNNNNTHTKTCSSHDENKSHSETYNCSFEPKVKAGVECLAGKKLTIADFESFNCLGCGHSFEGVVVEDKTLATGENAIRVAFNEEIYADVIINAYPIKELTKEPTYKETGLLGDDVLPILNDTNYDYIEDNGVAYFVSKDHTYTIAKRLYDSKIYYGEKSFNDVTINFIDFSNNLNISYRDNDNTFVFTVSKGQTVSLTEQIKGFDSSNQLPLGNIEFAGEGNINITCDNSACLSQLNKVTIKNNTNLTLISKKGSAAYYISHLLIEENADVSATSTDDAFQFSLINSASATIYGKLSITISASSAKTGIIFRGNEGIISLGDETSISCNGVGFLFGQWIGSKGVFTINAPRWVNNLPYHSDGTTSIVDESSLVNLTVHHSEGKVNLIETSK